MKKRPAKRRKVLPPTASGALTARIQTLRAKAGMTQAEAAARAAMKQPQWADLERNRRSVTLNTLVRVAAALGVTPADLLIAPARKSARIS